MAFFSKKKKEQQQVALNGNSNSNNVANGYGPTNPPMSPNLAGSLSQPVQGPMMYAIPSNMNTAAVASSYLDQSLHHNQSNFIPTVSGQVYPGPAQPLSNGAVRNASPTPFSANSNGVDRPLQPSSPQQTTYINGSAPSRSFANPGGGGGGGGGGNGGFMQSSSSNASIGPSTTYPGASSYPTQQQQNHHQQQPPQQQPQHGTQQQQQPPSTNPVSYPWSQRLIRTNPIQTLPNTDPSAVATATTASSESISPFPRYGHSVNPIAQTSSGDLYLFGGLVKEQVRNDLYMINCAAINPNSGTTSNDSKLLAASPINVTAIETRGETPCPRVGHASVSVGNVLIVWGGDTKTKEEDPQDDNLYLLNLGSRDWTLVKVLGRAPQGRYGHAAAMRGSKFYIFGGQQDVSSGAPDDEAFLNDLWWFDLQNLKAGKPHWSNIQYAQGAPIPPKRTGHTMVNSNDCLYIFGGTDGQYHYNDTWCFNTTTSTWSELSCIGYIPVPREGHAATLVDDVVYVFGGRSVDGKDLEDLAAFKISNQRWYMFTNMGPAPSGRSGHAMASWQNKVFVLGGESYTSNKHDWPNMVHMLDTGKIKYPSDSRLGNRKLSNAKLNAPAPSYSATPGLQGAATTVIPSSSYGPVMSKPVQQIVLEDQKRAASPTESERERELNGLKNSNYSATSSSFHNNNRGLPNGTTASTVDSPPARGGPSPTPRQGPLLNEEQQRSGGGLGMGARRPSDAGRRAMSPIDEQSPMDGPIAAARSLSPIMNNHIVASSSMQSIAAGSAPPASATATMATALRSQPQPTMNGYGATASSYAPVVNNNNNNGNPINALRSNARSPSPVQSQMQSPQQQQQYRSLDSYSEQDGYQNKPTQMQQEAHQQNRQPQQTTIQQQRQQQQPSRSDSDDELNRLRQRELWMQAALAAAVQQGFTLPVQNLHNRKELGDLGLEQKGDSRQFMDALFAVKREMSEMKSLMAEEAKYADQRIAQSNKGRVLALQEASFYRSKIAALEANNTGDLFKLERGRIADLERRIAEVGTAKMALERRAQALDSQLDHHRDLPQASSERESSHLERAEAAEASYSRSLTDFAELQRRTHSNDSMIQDHLGKIATLESQVTQAESQQFQTNNKLVTCQSSLDQHLRVLEQTRTTLASAHARSNELESLWTRSKEDITHHQERSFGLETDLSKCQLQLEAAQSRIEDLETALQTSNNEIHSLRDLTSGHLKQILDSSSSETRDGDKNGRDMVDGHVLQAMQQETEKHRNLVKEAHSRTGAAQSELRDARVQHINLEKQISVLRNEMTSLRTRHAVALDTSSRAQELVNQRDMELLDKSRSIEAAEVRAGLLKSILTENGLDATQSENGSPSLGSEIGSAVTLKRKVTELEMRLDQRSQSTRELQNMHDEARQEADSSRHRLRISEEQVEDLNRQVEQLRMDAAAASSLPKSEGAESMSQETASRAERAEMDLMVLQDKHQQLETTHMKAVQYVKGTEKMFRRMKDELTKYKERNEILETEIASSKASSSASQQQLGHTRSMSSELRNELEDLRGQLFELRQHSEQFSSQNEDLQNHIRSLKAEYDHTSSQQQSEHSEKLAHVNSEVEQLHDALDKAQREVDETLNLNRQLNVELQNAMKRPMSPGRSANPAHINANEPWSEAQKRLEQELSSVNNRAEWLKRENTALEERCRESESKVTLLLDHIESSGGVEAVASSVGHSTDHEHERWKSVGGDTRSEAGSDYSHSLDSVQHRRQHSGEQNGR